MIVFLLLAEETLGENEFPTKHNLNQTISQGKCRAKSQLNSSIEADWLAALFGYKLQPQKLPCQRENRLTTHFSVGELNPHIFIMPLPK